MHWFVALQENVLLRFVDHPLIAFLVTTLSAILVLLILFYCLRRIVPGESARRWESAVVSIVVTILFSVFLTNIFAMRRDRDNRTDSRLRTLQDRHLDQLKPILRTESAKFELIAKDVDREAYVDAVTKKSLEARSDEITNLLWPHVMSKHLMLHFPEYDRSKQNLFEEISHHDAQFVDLKEYVERQLKPAGLPEYWKNIVSLSVIGHCLGTSHGMNLKVFESGYTFSYWGAEVTSSGVTANPPRPSLDQMQAFQSYDAFVKASSSEADFTSKCENLKHSGGPVSKHASELIKVALLLAETTSLKGECEFVADRQ